MFAFYEKLTPFGDTILEDDDTEDDESPNVNLFDAFFLSFLEEDNDIVSMDSKSSKPLEIITDLPETCLESALTFESMCIETQITESIENIRPLVEEIIQTVLEKIDISETEQIMDKETEILEEIPEEKQQQNPEQVTNKNCGFCVLQ